MKNETKTDLELASDFVNEVAYMLSVAQKAALQKKIRPLIKKYGFEYGLTDAIHEVLSSIDAKDYWLYLHFDLRDYREVEWQAQAAAKTHGIKADFNWQPQDLSKARVYHGLVAFSVWLKTHQFSLVTWGEDDMYRNFVVPDNRLPQFLASAAAVGLSCYVLENTSKVFDGFVVEKIIDRNYPLAKQLAESAKLAHSKGFKTYFYLMTSWCKPCRDVVDAFDSPIFVKILKNAHILTIDYDFWVDQIDEVIALEKLTSVPIFGEIDENGAFTGRLKEIDDSDNPDENTPEELARVFSHFFTTPTIKISITNQILTLFDGHGYIKEKYPVSTAANGAGCLKDSGCTPLGAHIIRAKIGAGAAANTVFVGRRPTGEICTPELMVQYSNRDWILTRILWLSGTEIGKNRLGNVDTMQRYIYIHGTPDSTDMSVIGSHGCIRMRNADMIALFDLVEAGTPVVILE